MTSNVGSVVAALGRGILHRIYYAGSIRMALRLTAEDLQLAKEVGLIAVIDEFATRWTASPLALRRCGDPCRDRRQQDKRAQLRAMNNGNHLMCGLGFLKPDEAR
jgi:hypothetical protein